MGSQYDDSSGEPSSAFESRTFDKDVSIYVNEAIGAASISPSGRDVVLASRNGLNIIDLDSPYSPPRYIANRSQWDVADVQWSPFASRAHWIVSTSNQKALVYNLELSSHTSRAPIEYTLHAHTRAITDINFSAHHPDELATCAVDSFVHCWDLRQPYSPALSLNSAVKFAKPFAIFADWDAGATQVKWNRQDSHIIASSHDRYLRVWDRRNGAIPLKTIAAHSTKIYGIDWNRTRSTGILTCSLDKTIKIWDYSKATDDSLNAMPDRVFRTPYPVWRARHTPFGWGVLAMPQRGSFDLHLYDRRLNDGMKRDAVVPPVYSFEGHSDCVKEFLWRSRGNIDNGIDNRDFQLVSWGTDRYLHLHKMHLHVLKAVGHEKGKEVFKKPGLTRQGAVYMSFRDEPKRRRPQKLPKKEPEKDTSQPKGHLSTLFQAAMSKTDFPSPHTFIERGAMSTSTGMQGRNKCRRLVNTIKWMEGVKIGNRETDTHEKWGTRGGILPPAHQYSWDTPESLGDEITYVGGKFRKVTFEEVDVSRRTVTVSLYGPWSAERKAAFVRISIKFPSTYPRESTPLFNIEKTTAAIADGTLMKLNSEIQSLAELYQSKKRGCLEAIISYALGERGLEESITWLSVEEENAKVGLEGPVNEESSSDEEDGVGADFNGVQTQDLELSGNDILASGNANVNVPVRKQCGAMWAEDGRLVCFFPPKPEPKPMFSLASLRPDRISKSRSIFDTFGRLTTDSPGTKNKPTFGTGGAEDEERVSAHEHESWASSSSTSPSSSSEEDDFLPAGRFQPPAAWRRATLKFQKSSQHSSAGHGNPVKPKSIVSIIKVEEQILPCKRVLAEKYKTFGDGPTVCTHNAALARMHGFQDLGDIWELCKLILCNDVPLEILAQQHRREQVLVLARRSLVRIKRKDSGLDLAFDEADAVANPKLTGRIKWGRHPVVAWLIPALFEHFEKLADTQMLAMLSCIFSEPAANEGVSSVMQRLRQSDLPMSMEAPAFSLDYFPSSEAAWSLYQPLMSIPSTPTISHAQISTPVNPWERLEKRLDTFGSASSSNGPWGSDNAPSDPVTPYSTGNTPPTLSRPNTHRSTASATASYSTSPELHHQHVKKSNSNLASAFASLSRPFSITASSSPPTHPKPRSDADLSTSAPTSGITWGTNTFYSSGSATNMSQRSKHGKRASFGQFDGPTGYDSDEESWPEEEASDPVFPSTETESETTIKVTLKNQNQFDDEACVSLPLLERPWEWKYKHYRASYAEQLGVWKLTKQRAEVLKFNGLISYWPEQPKREGLHTSQPSQRPIRHDVGVSLFAPCSKVAGSAPFRTHRVYLDSFDALCLGLPLHTPRPHTVILPKPGLLDLDHMTFPRRELDGYFTFPTPRISSLHLATPCPGVPTPPLPLLSLPFPFPAPTPLSRPRLYNSPRHIFRDRINTQQQQQTRRGALEPPPAPSYPRRSPPPAPPASPQHFAFNPEASAFVPSRQNPYPPTHSKSQSRPQSLPEVVLPEAPSGEAAFVQELDLGIQLDGVAKLSSEIEVATRELLGQEGEERGTAVVRVCSVCWIKVEGLFYFCAQCGHIAHAACVGVERGNGGLCVAHCGCDCVVDEGDTREARGENWWVGEDEAKEKGREEEKW